MVTIIIIMIHENLIWYANLLRGIGTQVVPGALDKIEGDTRCPTEEPICDPCFI